MCYGTPAKKMRKYKRVLLKIDTLKGVIMNTYIERLKKNPLIDRVDLMRALLDICRPIKACYYESGTFLVLGNTGAHYNNKAAGMEGFSRILWGFAPLLAGGIDELKAEEQEEVNEILQIYIKGIKNGTNPSSDGYWSDVQDYDQKMVEMAALAIGICLAPEQLWDLFDEEDKGRIYAWFNQINQREVHKNNWRFFRILTNMMFQVRGLPFNHERLEEDFDVIEDCYQGQGWYFDGNPQQMDYYIPFAMHFYGLLYASFMKEKDQTRSKRFVERAATFANDFIYWFANDGTEIPFGRSLTYRFAHSAFFSAMAFNGESPLSWGVVKGTVLRNLRSWFEKPIFDESGILSIGYGYPNLIMSERYNSPGSPYWALKTFLVLALDRNHPFWKAEEEEFNYESSKCLRNPKMIITHEEQSNHVQAFVTGQHCMNHGNSPSKYEKFVYSNIFGFSVSRGSELSDGAFDNTLAVSLAGNNTYRMRNGTIECRITNEYTYARYIIMPGVEIESYIIPCVPWHVRIHRIKTAIQIDIADGGYAIGVEKVGIIEGVDDVKTFQTEVINDDKGAFIRKPWGISGITSEESGTYSLINSYPNTNVLWNSAIIPTFCKRLEPGNHRIITSVLGEANSKCNSSITNRPNIKYEKNAISIQYGDKQVIIEV